MDIGHASVDEGGINFSYSRDQNVKIPWKEKDVCICMAVYKDVPQQAFFSFMALAIRYKDSIRLEYRGGDAMIARSRNHIAKRFLKGGASWSIWFDDDMIFPFGHAGIYNTMTGSNLPERFASMHVIERLISHGRSIVGGCYWDRNGGGRLIAGGSAPILNPIPSDNLQAINFVGTGCLAVHRQVYLDIAKKFPETMDEDSLGNESGFFTPIQTNQRMKGEDESFAWRATEAGHPSYLDLGLCCGHIGTQVHAMPKNGSRI